MTAKRKCVHATSLQIRAARAVVDISRDHLAIKAGVNERAVRSAERIGCERRTVAREKIVKALVSLGCDPCAIILGALEPVAAQAASVEPARTGIPVRAAAARIKPERKTAPAKVSLRIASNTSRPAMKLKTVPVSRPAVKVAAPQPAKANPVSVPPLAPIAVWSDDRTKIAQAVEGAKQKWSARPGPKADTVPCAYYAGTGLTRSSQLSKHELITVW